jgi:hypothetical protein
LQKRIVVGVEQKVWCFMGSIVKEMESKAGFGGGIEDVYGEDCATDDQVLTPWTASVAR